MAYLPIKASSQGGGKDFELVPPGTHYAICVGVYYLGIQKTEFKGEIKELPKVYFRFEIPDVQIEYEKDGKPVKGPAIIGREFTLSIGKKSNLAPFITNWRGKPFTESELKEFDVTSLLGKVCNLGVVHETKGNGKTYANISSAGKILQVQQDMISAGTLSAKSHNEPLTFNADSPDPVVLDKMPKFLRRKYEERITTTKGGKPLQQTPQAVEGQDFDDNIPF